MAPRISNFMLWAVGASDDDGSKYSQDWVDGAGERNERAKLAWLDGFRRVESSQTPARRPQFGPNVQKTWLHSRSFRFSCQVSRVIVSRKLPADSFYLLVDL
jgi:hypothetical protein